VSPPEPNSLPEADELRPLFPQFELEQRIGVGGMGVVYRAIQISVERPVALKILSPHLAEDEDFRDRFTREAKAMAKLRHPGLVQVHDFGTAGESLLWMAQEWIEGETLFCLFDREGALAADESAGLVMQVCQSLGYAHSKGIIHRDIKPANLMVTPEGQVRVMDFGLARATRGGPANLVSRNRTRLGTPEYAAPELFDEGVEIDHHADIFALGVLLYQSLTGRLPEGAFQPPSELNPSIDPRYDVIVIRSMQRDPANRYSSCLDFEQALRSVVENPVQAGSAVRAPLPGRRLITGASDSTTQLAAAAATSAPAERPEPASKKPRGKLRLVIRATAAVLILGAAGWGFIAMRGGESDLPAQPIAATPDKPKPERPASPTPAPKPTPDKPKPVDPDKAVVATPDPPKPPPPDPTPAPKPPTPAEDDGQAGRMALAELDEKLSVVAKPLLAEFVAKRGELLPTYASEAAKAEQAAIAAGKLDDLMFWERELKCVLESGELPADDGPVPAQAEPLRKGWRKHILPLRAQFDELRFGHAEECRGRAEDFEQAAKPVSASLLRKRAEGAESFTSFLTLCGWQPELPPQGAGPDAGPLAAAGEQFPADLLPLHELVRARLTGQDSEQGTALIRAYGSRLVATRKQLAAAGNSDAAEAIGEVEQQLLGLLGKGKPTTPDKPPAPIAAAERILVAGGEPGDDCLWERKQWKRHGRSMECVEGGYIRFNGVLGAGDFEIKARLKLPKIDDTHTKIVIGGTCLYLDIQPGEICLKPIGLNAKEHKGARLGSFAKPDEWFDVLVKRTGEFLSAEINGKPALGAPIESGPAGAPGLRLPVPGSAIESFSARGSWEQGPPEPILVVGRQDPIRSKGMSQLLPLKGDKLVNLFISCPYKPLFSLWSIRSTNGGAKWTEAEMLADHSEGTKPVGSFAAASDPERDQVIVLYASGKSNHRVLCRRSSNGGASWKDSEDLTDQVKQGGWNVRFGAQGLALTSKSPKPGRIVLPVSFSRGETEAGHPHWDSFVLISDDGETWRRIGPVIEQAGSDGEIFEDHQGTLWITNPPADRRPGAILGLRSRVSSKDGGETWSESVEISWPDLWDRGTYLAAQDTSGKLCWYYCTTDGPPRKAPPPRPHLAIFRSYDRGANWQLLRHFFHGSSAQPTLLFSGQGSLLVSFREDRWDTGYDRIQFTELPLEWLEATDHSLR